MFSKWALAGGVARTTKVALDPAVLRRVAYAATMVALARHNGEGFDFQSPEV